LLKYTFSVAGFVPKLVPVIVTTVFFAPDVGLIDVTVGAGSGVGAGVSSFLQLVINRIAAMVIRERILLSFIV
jgi:hypothetical protein